MSTPDCIGCMGACGPVVSKPYWPARLRRLTFRPLTEVAILHFANGGFGCAKPPSEKFSKNFHEVCSSGEPHGLWDSSHARKLLNLLERQPNRRWRADRQSSKRVHDGEPRPKTITSRRPDLLDGIAVSGRPLSQTFAGVCVSARFSGWKRLPPGHALNHHGSVRWPL
jgi:hypothetical protein